ncbi:unnamed protein product [Auanema sp. JU1783]|nr:unnamed protein product [Auanema sp. JU1783]
MNDELLKPEFVQSDTDLLNIKQGQVAGNLLYSDPTLNLDRNPIEHSQQHLISDHSIDITPLTSQYNLDCSSSININTGKSAIEIRDQHYEKQKKYAAEGKKKSRQVTSIDFEGILDVIGGCDRWQVLVYLFISAQQVPHAMFNLSVVYMMYQPDHWCKIPYFNEASFRNESTVDYSWDQILNSSVAFPMKPNKQRKRDWHSQCDYYDRDYIHLKTQPWASLLNLSTDVSTLPCSQWEYDQSVMKKTVVTEWNRVCDNNWSRAHVHLSYSLGYLFGCFLGGFVSDRYGRKTAIFGFSILSAIFGLSLVYTPEFEMFLVIRFLLAASNEAADLAAYVLCMEITGVKYRSIVGSLLQAPWALGYALLAFVAFLTKSWDTIQLITVILHVMSVVLLYFVPESPRWLIMKDKVTEAEPIIRKACILNNRALPSDLGLVRHAEKQKILKTGEQPTFFHLFRTAELRFRYIVLLIVWIATALVYYGLVIALSDQSSPGRSVFDGNFFLNNAIAGAIELPTLVCCVFLLNYGRKKSQMITLIGAGTLLLAAMWATIRSKTTTALVCMLLGKAFIQGAFNILYIFTSELSPTVVRNTAVGISSMMARMGAGASGYIAILSDVTLATVPMLIFAIFSLCAGVLVLFLPETQYLPLPDTISDAVMMRTRGKSPCDHKASTFETESLHDDDTYRKATSDVEQN